ncbi:fumarate reductase cytochrome b subunit [uncultured Desulfobacter sp.]|uniref:fumarate reductase cytochrome b subunit n=1 Tax=uncultured Desulfobacter sp. TaxID=240139 RepID=UPI002AAB1656|nr:fumarate reductase cytochrome b subunit [uncultured Desulfobacter sp.]
MERYTIESDPKKSRLPARLDFLQSATGLVLGLFVWAHIILTASIILGPKAFNWVVRNMELGFLSHTGHGYPIAAFFAVLIVFTLFIMHALLGMGKFPGSWEQLRIMKEQMALIKHQDTNLWYIQALTGFIMFFAGSVHLYAMLSHPGSMDSYLCAHRVVYNHMWFIYLILLACVALHANIGLYRLCMKWGWFQGADHQRSRKTRAKLKKLMDRLIIIFLSAGLLTLLVFVFIGLRHHDDEPHEPSYATQRHDVEPAEMHQAPARLENTPEELPEAAPEDFSIHEDTTPEAQTVHEEAPEEAAPLIEEPLTHDSPPDLQDLQDIDSAHEEAVDDPGTVQEDAQGHDVDAHEAIHEETQEQTHEELHEETQEEIHEEAGPLDSDSHVPEDHAIQGQSLPIDGGHGPEETF